MVRREVSKHQPLSMLTSTMTDPSRMPCTMDSVTIMGVRPWWGDLRALRICHEEGAWLSAECLRAAIRVDDYGILMFLWQKA